MGGTTQDEDPDGEPPGGARPARAVAVVAHPDDETLWAGGAIMLHADWDWTVVTLCRASDPDRAPKFARAVARLGAAGRMADLDDGPDQAPLADGAVRGAVLDLVRADDLDYVLTHGPRGEYTRHRRHEEVSRAVCGLWSAGSFGSGQLWLFAYDDEDGAGLPRAVAGAHATERLSAETFGRKRGIIEQTYGFGPESFEARACPRDEAFWVFESPDTLRQWLQLNGGQR